MKSPLAYYTAKTRKNQEFFPRRGIKFFGRLFCLTVLHYFHIIDVEITKGGIVFMQQISPVEDLMREHGLLHRILLIYQRIIDRLKADAMCAPVNVYQLS